MKLQVDWCRKYMSGSVDELIHRDTLDFVINHDMNITDHFKRENIMKIANQLTYMQEIDVPTWKLQHHVLFTDIIVGASGYSYYNYYTLTIIPETYDDKVIMTHALWELTFDKSEEIRSACFITAISNYDMSVFSSGVWVYTPIGGCNVYDVGEHLWFDITKLLSNRSKTDSHYIMIIRKKHLHRMNIYVDCPYVLIKRVIGKKGAMAQILTAIVQKYADTYKYKRKSPIKLIFNEKTEEIIK